MTNLARRIAVAAAMVALALGSTATAAQAESAGKDVRIAADTSWSY